MPVPLTSADIPAHDVGALAVETAMGLLDGRSIEPAHAAAADARRAGQLRPTSAAESAAVCETLLGHTVDIEVTSIP